MFVSNFKVNFENFVDGFQYETLKHTKKRKLRNSRQSREFASNADHVTVLERIFSLKFNPLCMQTKDNGKFSLTTHVICIGNPKLSSRRDEFRAMQIILAIRCIDIESRLREECHPKLSRLLGSTMSFLGLEWSILCCLFSFITILIQIGFRVNLGSSQMSPIIKCGFTKQVDRGRITTVKDQKSFPNQSLF